MLTFRDVYEISYYLDYVDMVLAINTTRHHKLLLLKLYGYCLVLSVINYKVGIAHKINM